MSAQIKQHLAEASDAFTKLFGKPPTHAAVAPGRVNLIGEHTDYNDGFVLPLAIDYQTITLARLSDNDHCNIATTFETELVTFDINKDLVPSTPQWANYPKGVARFFLECAPTPPAFNALVHSTVPYGSGLSSSAALEVSFATLLESLTEITLDPILKARIAQQAEHQFAGAPCGIMDQFISTLGHANHAMLLDCRTEQYKLVPLHDSEITILIINSNVEHDLSTGEYAIRRNQCQQAAAKLEVKSLRDVTLDQLNDANQSLDPILYRRAHHVITENARTQEAAKAMMDGDYHALGNLMNQSHDSLERDYEVSCDELNLLVDLTRNGEYADDVFGSRMTGGGFGGCTVSLVKTSVVENLAKYIREQYTRQTGIIPDIITTRPANGTRILEI